jgi:homoserine/homoserine lactone efflux protein
MEISSWITYVVATFILSLTPGPGVFSCLSSGMRHGFRKGVWNGVGMQAANVILVIVVSLGLGAILMASQSLFATVKWVGVAYLLYLGVATWRAPVKVFEEEKDDTPASARDIFMRGFWVNATNPKGLIFFAAILPQFIDVTRPQFAQYAIFAATTFAIDLAAMAGYTALAARVLKAMRDPSRIRWVNRGIGGAFVACGVALASLRRIASAAA